MRNDVTHCGEKPGGDVKDGFQAMQTSRKQREKFTLDEILFLGTHKATVANQRTTKVEEYGGGQYNKRRKEKMEGNQRTRNPD